MVQRVHFAIRWAVVVNEYGEAVINLSSLPQQKIVDLLLIRLPQEHGSPQ
jgi:hypothetical protein